MSGLSIEGVSSIGTTMDTSTRSWMEGRFGADFRHVRLHTGPDAHRLTDALEARALTYGQDIYFGLGEYQPQSIDGQHLIAHELAHTLQGSPMIHRQPRPARVRVTTQAEFERIMLAMYGVTVRTGTEASQRAFFTLAPGGPNPLPNWRQWNPEIGGVPEMYDEILRGYADFAAAFGGTPNTVPMITFYRTHYEHGPNGTFIESPGTGGLTSPTEIQLYDSTRTVFIPNATARSRPPGLRDGYFDTGEASLRQHPGNAATRTNVYHELGHGLMQSIRAAANTTVQANNDIQITYNRTVGWASDFHLYDIGQQQVRDEIRANRVPPANFQITVQNWNSGRWVEQPITNYMVTGSSDDFAEAVRAYLHTPQILSRRSPTRYHFMHNMHTTHPAGLRATTPPVRSGTQPRR